MIRFLTSGESHGKGLMGIIDGIPANLYIDEDYINRELERRQKGFGRSERMNIEKDKISIVGGVMKNHTMGSPISIYLENRGTNIELVEVITPRPGHGDLVGTIKYNQKGGRNILERASARETAMRVALGGICKLLLREFNIEIFSHIINIGGIWGQKHYYKGITLEELKSVDKSSIRVIDGKSEESMIEKINEAFKSGDTLGGTMEIILKGVPIGIGSHINWDTKLDGKLAAGIMSIPGLKAVEFGYGTKSASTNGSEFHDEIFYDKGYKRKTNYAGGIEAGISNGEDIVIKAYMKPIPTLRLPLETVNMVTKDKAQALSERSDICAVPSASIVAESMVAYILANEFLRKFGGDSMEEIKYNYLGYMDYIKGK